MGSMLEFESVSREGAGETALRIFITGNTLMHDELKDIPRRFLDIDLALSHMGGTKILETRSCLKAIDFAPFRSA